MDVLSRADEILLLTILNLKNNAYGVSIVKEVKIRTGKNLKIGGLWVSLDILAKKGLILKRIGDPTPRRGGRSKIYYSLTPAGLKSLKHIREFNQNLWRGMTDILEDRQA
ncbi:MAG: PadR family transcriptional regulator [Candidatus Aminicenantes bacterium]|nr:PadR family transcriptional regulator [Candidatus Aminicenantes bacterium]